MHRAFSVAAALAVTFSLSSASQPSCSPSQLCPQETPCCGQYGLCGVGAYCLGGCDPISSYDLQSCVAAPVCKSENYALTSLTGIQSNEVYLGDSSSTNWVSSGTPVVYNDEAILLTMAPNTVGTLLTSTNYVWYGKISAEMTTSQGQGVVTAFIMMSSVKDEIDFEFVGDDIDNAQSNFYWQGVTDYDNEVNISVSNTVATTHTYTIDWTPESITWSVDGNVGRTLNKADTYNTTDNTYHYPQTPAQIELSLWPAGLSTNAPGTVNWAGGLVDWDSPYMQNGYYYAMIKSVDVECYSPPSGVPSTGSSVYYYTSRDGLNTSIATGGNSTTLASLYATGDDLSENPNASTNTASTATSSATPETVPGISGAGNQGLSGSGDSGAAASVSGTASAASSTSTGFIQGNTGTTTSSSQAAGGVAVSGSAVALLGFFVAALML